MKKKFLSLLLVVAMLATFVMGAVPVSAESTDDFYYRIDNGEITLTRYKGAGGAVVIPSEIGGLPVVTIGSSFIPSNDTTVTSVVISEGIRTIENQAFMFAFELKSVSIPASVTHIGVQAFAVCQKLESITVAPGNSAYCVDNGVLFNKAKTSLILYPAAKSGTSYTIPSSVTRIESNAFLSCTNLTDINIPSSVQSIGYNAFEACGMYDDYNNWDRRAFIIDGWIVAISYTVESSTSYAMSENVKGIADYAFSWCENLKSIDLPGTLQYIGRGAFVDSVSLQNVNFAGSEAQWNAVVIDEENESILNANKVFRPTADVKNGWKQENGKWYYYTNNVKVVNKWMKDSKGWVYLGSDGAMKTNAWCTDSNGWCYVGADGYAVTNTWKKDSKGWIYLNANGSMTKAKWVKDGGKWYYCDANGYMVANKWQKDSKGWVKLGADGAMLTNKWTTDSKGWCYVGADGYAVTNCWKKDSKGWIWLDANGSMTKSKWLKDGGNWYYLDANGYMVANKSMVISGKQYNFNASGVCTNPQGTAYATYVLNTKSKKFHYPSCGSADTISAENKSTYTGSRDSLINQGYNPCGNCQA